VTLTELGHPNRASTLASERDALCSCFPSGKPASSADAEEIKQVSVLDKLYAEIVAKDALCLDIQRQIMTHKLFVAPTSTNENGEATCKASMRLKTILCEVGDDHDSLNFENSDTP